MKKKILKEMILPLFWLFFFMVYTNIEDKNNTLEKEDEFEIRRATGLVGIDKSRMTVTKIPFTNAVFISRY